MDNTGLLTTIDADGGLPVSSFFFILVWFLLVNGWLHRREYEISLVF
jgi:hypothetical protein